MEVLTSEEETRILTETSNIDVDKLEHYIDLFEKWFDGQKHLPKTYGGSCFKKFLIWAKLDFEKAKKRFVKFCYNTVTHKEFFCNRSITLKTELEPLKYLQITILKENEDLLKHIPPQCLPQDCTILKGKFLKHIPPQCLPQDCGGSSETLQQLKKKLEQHFVDNSKFYVDLGNLQPTGPIPIPEEYKDNYSNEFGSFRKLNID
ncbi:hypothetical protein QE152_g5936 [Popillia japonica]|uniref:Uncharacterized protein n=1 Tax=Popillia japonica TaxID=7064 RepID=A0AAW1MLG5_POPJA